MNTTQNGDAAGERPASDRHVPIMCERIVELLAPALQQPGAVYLDGTLGMGGHTEAILSAFPQAVAYGVDRDPAALELASRRLAGFGQRFHPIHAVNDEAFALLAQDGVERFDAVLFDLGVSSFQLDEDERGFSYSRPGPLDMRMDQTTGMTAADVLNEYDAADLERILKEYGEERFARRIAAEIVRRRGAEPFENSRQLVSVLDAAIPAANRRAGGHPGKRTFQALRIEVNDELGAARRAVRESLTRVRLDGRVAVLTFHSLEDRMVKQTFAEGTRSRTPAGMPVERPEDAPWLRAVTRGSETPDADEMSQNPRASSARLRVVQRIRETEGTIWA